MDAEDDDGEGGLVVELDHNRTAFKEAASCPPLSYEKKGRTIDLSFWRTPERLFDETDELVMWSRTALEAARRKEGGQRQAKIKA